jgi:hypothetical protein
MAITEDRVELLNLYNQTVENFDEMLTAGVISKDDYAELKNDALEELNYYLSDLEGFNIEEENESEEGDYSTSKNSDLATFSSGFEPQTRFGAALIELGYRQGYENVKDLIGDLAEATGNEEENIFELLIGEAAPDDNFAFHATELFGLDENESLDLVAAGYEARGEDFEEVLNLLEDEETNEESEEDNAVYSRVNELEDELANFKAEQVMKDALSQRESVGYSLVQQGKMPPVIYDKLFANFNSDSDKIAAFSKVANANGVSLEAELHSIDKVLDIFDSMPEMGVFTSYSDELKSEEELNEDMAIEQQAKRQVQLRKQRQEGLV